MIYSSVLARVGSSRRTGPHEDATRFKKRRQLTQVRLLHCGADVDTIQADLGFALVIVDTQPVTANDLNLGDRRSVGVPGVLPGLHGMTAVFDDVFVNFDPVMRRRRSQYFGNDTRKVPRPRPDVEE